MNILINSYIKGLIVTIIVVSVSIGSAVVVDKNSVFIPQHQFNFELTDTLNDVNDSQIDIIRYGSFKQKDAVVLYLEVTGVINTSLNYRLFIVAKTPGEESAHIYFNDVTEGKESNYQSVVIVDGNRLEVHFSQKQFITNSYMTGVEVSASSFSEEDNTPSARDNPLKTLFLGIF
ncbi:hypothetical protein [Candidatus Hodarchaeum mangrovi]